MKIARRRVEARRARRSLTDGQHCAAEGAQGPAGGVKEDEEEKTLVSSSKHLDAFQLLPSW